MKIALLSTSDILGGAAVVSKRLVEAFIAGGHDARLIVMHRYGEERPYIVESGHKTLKKLSFLGERVDIFFSNSLNRGDLFKVSSATTSIGATASEWIRKADVILLGWINQGFLSLKDIARLCSLGKPVIWTMHDQWCMTGICHLAGECNHFEYQCGNCPLLHHSKSSRDLSWRRWRKKMKLYDDFPNLHFVAVSRWLAQQSLKSSLLGKKNVKVIPNAFPIDSTPLLNNNKREPIIAMGAARLDDDVKGLPLAIEALNSLYSRHSDEFPGLRAVFFGKLRDKKHLEHLSMPYTWKGPLKENEIIDLFNNSKVVLSSSKFEMLPTTIIEGIAWGCLGVATDSGGQRDIIIEGENGFLAAANPDSLEKALYKALKANPEPRLLRETIASRFNPADIVGRYMSLIAHV